MNTSRAQRRPITDRELRAWLASGAVDRGIGDGLTFVASDSAARAGKASWILRFRVHGRAREKVLGRYPELSLKEARNAALRDRLLVQRGVDIAAAKQAERRCDARSANRAATWRAWFSRYIEPRHKHPEVVARVLRRHLNPILGAMPPTDVQPAHIDHVLNRMVAAGAPTVANDALRYLKRMFRMAVRNQWIDRNPAADFKLLDAGGEERARDRSAPRRNWRFAFLLRSRSSSGFAKRSCCPSDGRRSFLLVGSSASVSARPASIDTTT